MNRDFLNKLGGIILDACITVHKELGPGLLESAYVIALVRELSLREIETKVGVPVELKYKGAYLGKAYVLDILVENEIILEIKSVTAIEPIFKSQLITYLRLAQKQLGYLINFNVPLMKEGFQRVVHKF